MNREKLINYYNKFCEDKRLNSRHGQVEFLVTMNWLNKILKEGIHDKHIAYAKEHDIILPTFDYKCEVDAIMRELGALRD